MILNVKLHEYDSLDNDVSGITTDSAKVMVKILGLSSPIIAALLGSQYPLAVVDEIYKAFNESFNTSLVMFNFMNCILKICLI